MDSTWHWGPMGTLARLQMKAFTRRWPLMLVAVLAVLAAVALGGYEVLQALRSESSVADILAGFTRYSIIWPLAVIVLTYEFASSPRLVGMEESVAAYPETRHQHWLAMMVPSAALLVTIFAVYLSFKLVVIAVARQWTLLAWHIVAHSVLDVLVPCVIGMLLGAVAARHLSRYAGYAAIALFAFLIGPYFEIVPTLAQMGMSMGGGGVNLYPVYDLFRVLAPDPMWGFDPLYGFPLEFGRWMLAAFWSFGLLAVLLSAIVNPRTRRFRYLRIALTSFAVLCLAASLLPSSELRRDYRFFDGSSTVANQGYYQLQADEHPQKELPADFAVNRYEMQLSAGRQLSAVVSMDIGDDAHTDGYRFTLYHGYRISRVLGSDGERLGFVQEGDYVTVSSAEKQERVTFEYRGNGGICIANYQCVFLPGYFPYYPVPGFARTWDELRYSVGIPSAGRAPTEFSIALEARIPLVSDLEEHDGRFEGQSSAPSFVGGLLAEKTVAGHRVIYYPAGGGDPEDFKGLVARLRELEQTLGVTKSALPEGVPVIQLPGLAQYNASAVALPDALYVGWVDEGCAADVLVAGTPARMDRENLKEAFVRFINNPEEYDDESFVSDGAVLEGIAEEGPTDDEIASLEAARLSARDDQARIQKYVYPAKSAVFWLLREKVRVEGSSAALRDTYRYLSSDSPTSELEFLTQPEDGEKQ